MKRYPYVQVAAETWQHAPQLGLLFGISTAEAFMLLCTLYQWGQGLGPEDGDPTGLCESPRAVKLMAVAVGVAADRAEDLAECLEDLGFIEVLSVGVRVRGVSERYAGITARADARSEHARKAANARWSNAQAMPRASSEHAQPVLRDAKTQTQTQTQIDIKQLPLSAEKPADRADVVFEHWRKVMSKDARAKFDAKRRKAVEGRLRDGYSVDDLKRAIDGCAATPHNMGANDRNTRYDDLELICRDAAHVDRFRAVGASTGSKADARDDGGAYSEVCQRARERGLNAYHLEQLGQLTWHRDGSGQLVGIAEDRFFKAWVDEHYMPALNGEPISIIARESAA